MIDITFRDFEYSDESMDAVLERAFQRAEDLFAAGFREVSVTVEGPGYASVRNDGTEGRYYVSYVAIRRDADGPDSLLTVTTSPTLRFSATAVDDA